MINKKLTPVFFQDRGKFYDNKKCMLIFVGLHKKVFFCIIITIYLCIP
jgi:hypothetical protein